MDANRKHSLVSKLLLGLVVLPLAVLAFSVGRLALPLLIPLAAGAALHAGSEKKHSVAAMLLLVLVILPLAALAFGLGRFVLPLLIPLVAVAVLYPPLRKMLVGKRSKTAADAVRLADILKFPEGFLSSEGHSWVCRDGGAARLGIDRFAQNVVGQITRVVPPRKGEVISKGQPIAQLINSDGRLARVISPVDGVVAEINEALLQNPVIVNEDPYGKGWICRVQPSNWDADSRSLRDSREASQWIRVELDRLKAFVLRNVPATSEPALVQDGGYIGGSRLSSAISHEVWVRLLQEFLKEPRD